MVVTAPVETETEAVLFLAGQIKLHKLQEVQEETDKSEDDYLDYLMNRVWFKN